MKIKNNLDIAIDDFWYDLFEGGYIKPEDILQDQKDVENVKLAIKTLASFKDACDELMI